MKRWQDPRVTACCWNLESVRNKQRREANPEDVVEWSQHQCWRDPVLVRRLLSIRKRIIATHLKRANSRLAEELRSVTVTGSGGDARRAWQLSRQVKSAVWAKEHPKHQQKISHLSKRVKLCSKHNTCRKIDLIWTKRTQLKMPLSSQENV